MSNQPTTNHRSLTGFVTKLVGDGATYGFINDEIFFPQTNVAGGPASVGDQVFAECEFSAHMPIKWNATSVKIIAKAGGQQSNLRLDNQQQDMMNQQQQFNQSPTAPVAVTYQQHRQQRQQRQMLDVKPQEDNIINKQHQQNPEHAPRLLDQQSTASAEYFGPGGVGSFPPQQQQQQPDGSIQPFHDQPMGPPNFTYTSQLGSAFVQNQFVPPPFLAQQPPPMLPQQQQQPQQHLLPTNNQQMHNQQNNQRQNNKQGIGGGRFNNHGEKNNDRQQNNNRRNQNRNDNKFNDRSRSGDRDGSQNNRSSKRDSRERSLGKGSKREDPPVRPSPPPHSSARSTTSSDRGPKTRRHYEVQNIPKIQIMTNMNAYNMKQRCPSSVHVPSDLKDIIVNKYFRLDIKNTPKPLKFTIEQSKKEETNMEADKSSSEAKKEQTIDESLPKTEETTVESGSETTAVDSSSVGASAETKKVEQQTPPATKSDTKLNHKYGVKVILISLPELDTIYQTVFGSNLDSFNAESKPSSRLDDTISLLCNKGSNNGYSLIGGKFDPILDGFVEGESNTFERHGRQPDLIATCKRVVLEQTGLDLGECRGWNLLSTFMYNHKSDYFSSKASIEYSFIYMPQIWTLLSDNFDKNILNKETLNSTGPNDTQVVEGSKSPATKTEVQESEELTTEINDDQATTDDNQDDVNISSSSVTNTASSVTLGIDNLAELKVTDLKAELDRRDVKYKASAKKAELVALLQESLKPVANPALNQTEEETQQGIPSNEEENNPCVSSEDKAEPKEEGEVETNQSEESTISDADATTKPQDDAVIAEASTEATTNSDPVGKRKTSEVEATGSGDDGAPLSKKVCTEKPVPMKEQRVELIKESFIVRARDDQQQLNLVSLHEATQVSRYDQFELSVASNILKESLVQHLSEYILTTLVEDNRSKQSSTNQTNVSSSSGAQETSSDTNNNSTKQSTFKNPTTSSTSDQKVSTKELPVDRYINLAFTYFDSTHMGYVYVEDLNKLFNNTGLTISKRALISLVGDSEKFNYKLLPDLSPKQPPTYIYEFPEQFNRLPGQAASFSSNDNKPNLTTAGKMIEYKGVSYDVEKLIKQVQDAETLRVSLVDRFNYAIENSDKQAEEIHVLEVNQKSLAKAIKSQNDEICDLKRERDSIKKKYDSVRKGIKGAVSSLSDLIKDDK